MKKQNAYTIADDIFMDTLEIIYQNFSDVPYAIVGGGAVQVYIASVNVRHANLNSIKEIYGLSFILRRTGDIDISFRYDSAELVKKFNLIISQFSRRHGKFLNGSTRTKKGHLPTVHPMPYKIFYQQQFLFVFIRAIRG